MKSLQFPLNACMESVEEFCRCIRVRVGKFVQTARPSNCEILSLNCGEGDECIGICQELRQADVQRVSLVIHGETPDEVSHLDSRIRQTMGSCATVDQKTGNWMDLIREFAETGRQFHLMVLNITTVDDDQLKFMVSTLPQVLVDGGRVFVPNYHANDLKLSVLKNWGFFVVRTDYSLSRDRNYQCLEFINVICDAESAGEAESRRRQTSSDDSSSSSSSEDNDEWEEDHQPGNYFAQFSDQIRNAVNNSESETEYLGTWEDEADEHMAELHYAAGENSCAKGGDTVRSVYSNWLNSVNKDKTKFYKNAQFRQDYTKFQMPNRAATFCDTVQSQVNEFVKQNTKQKYRILSLGCGPGSDVIGVCNSIHRSDESKTIHCTGVDCCDWQWCTQASEKRRNSLQMMPDKVENEFLEQKMQDFSKHCAGEKFDLVILNYAGGQQIFDFVLKYGADLLSDNKSWLIVIDNNTKALQDLKKLPGATDLSKDRFIFIRFSKLALQMAAKEDKYFKALDKGDEADDDEVKVDNLSAVVWEWESQMEPTSVPLRQLVKVVNDNKL